MKEQQQQTNKNLQKFYFNRILFYTFFEGKSVLDTEQALLRDFWFNEAGVD